MFNNNLNYSMLSGISVISNNDITSTKKTTINNDDNINKGDDTLDRSFYGIIKEIQKSYISFPKVQRLRIEKWVEKLLTVTGNITWRKHRNSYAKLLLNMVITKAISDPFLSLPPDGPLGSFPSHLKRNFKDLLGAHESTFWRELYERINEVQIKSNEDPILNDDSSYSRKYSPYQVPNNDELYTSPNKSKHYNNNNKPTSLPFSPPSHPPSRHNNNNNKSNQNQVPSYSSHISQKSDKDMKHLCLLVKEQELRIQLLEQQLRDERGQYELQIQRLHHVHKIELDKLQNKCASLLSIKSKDLSSESSPFKQQSNLYNLQINSPSIQTDASFTITRSSNDLTLFDSDPCNITNNNYNNNNISNKNINNNENLKSMEDFYNASNQLSNSFDINSDINSITAAKILTNTISLNKPEKRIKTPVSFKSYDNNNNNVDYNEAFVIKQSSSALKSSNSTRNYQFKSSISNLQHDLNPNISIDNVDDFLESIDKFQSEMRNLQEN